jgi:hypothetical protein
VFCISHPDFSFAGCPGTFTPTAIATLETLGACFCNSGILIFGRLRRCHWICKSLCPVLDVGVARLTLCEFNEGCSLERAYPQHRGASRGAV